VHVPEAAAPDLRAGSKISVTNACACFCSETDA
jgi:hypothetical protein